MLRLPVVSPCDVPWEGMSPTRAGRRCAACDREVLDFTQMTELRARAILVLFQGRSLCGRVAYDEAGEAVFREEPEGRAEGGRGSGRRGGRSLPRTAALAAALAASGCVEVAAPAAVAPAPAPAATAAATETAGVAEAGGEVAEAPVDSDGDGIPDKDDRCPSRQGMVSGDPQTNGCPTVGVIVTTGDIRIVQHVLFASGSARPLVEAEAVLREVAEVMKQRPEIGKVRIVGHAAGDEKNGKVLSEKRASGVVAALVKLGVDASRLEAVGLGAERPIAAGGAPEDRAKNRRIEFEIVGSEACAVPGGAASP